VDTQNETFPGSCVAELEEQLLEYTKQIRSLTVTVAGATIVALAIAVVALIRS
jgi:hypothetical protein